MDDTSDHRSDRPTAGQCDSDEDGQWLTYVQLAEIRGVTLRAVMRQAQRQKLRRQPGNDGKTLVWVPRDVVGSVARHDRVSSRLDTSKPRSDRAGDVAVAVAALERAHERELKAKDELIADLRRDQSERRSALERSELRAIEAQKALASAELAARIAQDAAEALRQVDAARRARGRLRRAWDGWRGR